MLPGGRPVSEAATEYVMIHIVRRLYRNRIDQVLVLWLARYAADDGCVRTTQVEMADGIRTTTRGIRRAIQRLKTPDDGGPAVVERMTGRRWRIIGVQEHDESRCDELECRAKHRAGDQSERKRAKAAERVRRLRARRKAAQEANQGR